MKRIIICLTAALLLLSCGVPARVTSETPIATTRVVRQKETFDYCKDDHSACQRQADEAFRKYIKSRHLSKQLTGKRLVSLRPCGDMLQVTYLFRLLDGSLHKVVFEFENYNVRYRRTRS